MKMTKPIARTVSSRKEETKTDGIDAPLKRSLRLLPPTYAPSLVFPHGKKYRDQAFCTLFDGACHIRSIPELRGMRCVASCFNWLILQSYYSTQICYLFNPVSFEKIHLPPLLGGEYDKGCLTSTPSDPNSFVMLYSKSGKAVVFCRITGGTQWTEQSLLLGRGKRNPSLVQSRRCDVVSCNGKIYIFLLLLVVVIHITRDNFASVEYHERPDKLFCSLPETGGFEPFIVESCGEIFEVVGLCLGRSRIFLKFDVFRLDIATMERVGVENLGDRIFLLSKVSTACVSTKGLEGREGNRIYYTSPDYTTLSIFDMDDGTITTTHPTPQEFSHWGRPFWLVPDCRQKAISPKDAPKAEEPKFQVYNENEKWKDLPVDLLQVLLSSTCLGDCIRFRLTCRTWTPIVQKPVQTGSNFLHSSCGPEQVPWLMSFPNINKGVCSFNHPIYGDSYTVSMPELTGAVIRDAKYGWLLMSRKHFLFFFNLITMETIQLPERLYYGFQEITFSTPPTSSDCIVVGLESLYPGCFEMWFYHVGKEHENGGNSIDFWQFQHIEYDKEYEFVPAHCRPVYCNGVFYCLSKDGKIGIFNPLETDENRTWQILPARPIGDFTTSIRCFLVESDGEMLSVFVDIRGKHTKVYKFDESKMEWRRLECLGDKVLFLSPTTSMLLPACLKGIEDKIYFPKFHEGNNTFYSLSKTKNQCFECGYRGEECKNTRELGNCTWIQFHK